jgi:Outer membrane protein beta-barrel domain
MRVLRSLLTLVMLGVPSAVAAQDVSFGVKGGLNLSTTSYDPEPEVGIGLRPGVVLGGFVNLPLGSRLAIQPEGFFSQKGNKLELPDADLTVELAYIEVPILLQYAFSSSPGRGFFVFGGPSIGFKIDAELGATVGEDEDEFPLDEEVEDFDIGIAAGAGYNFGRYTIDGRYTFGLSNTSVDKALPKSRNRTIAILLGVHF